MIKKEVVQLEVQLVENSMRPQAMKVDGLLKGLIGTSKTLGSTIDAAVNPDTTGLSSIIENVSTITDSLTTIADKLGEIVALMAPQEESWLASMIGGVEILNTLGDAREK